MILSFLKPKEFFTAIRPHKEYLRKSKNLKSNCYKFILILFVVFLFNHEKSFCQNQKNNQKLGISLDAVGMFVGEYSLGIFSFLSQNAELGLSGTRYATRNRSPNLLGWSASARANWFFSRYDKSGFYLGGIAGFESVEVSASHGNQAEIGNDVVWGIIPGYSFVFQGAGMLAIGVQYGHKLGETGFFSDFGFYWFL
jgi:hypothetical protein